MRETRWRRNGVVAIDDTLLPKTGEGIPGAGKLWDHNSNSIVYGQSLVTSHYVNQNRDYPHRLQAVLQTGEPRGDEVRLLEQRWI
mgnify:CR=1 FL=1